MPKFQNLRKPRFSSDHAVALSKVTDSARRGHLVAVIGTGVSLSLTNGQIQGLSWKGLVLDGFVQGVKKGKISPEQSAFWKPQLDSKDLDDLLGAAEFMGRKLGAPGGELYARWLENTFKDVKPANPLMEEALRSLHAGGIPFCTLNYDSLLETVTGLPTINITDTAKVTAWMRREGQGILHLHGSWDSPTTCILGIRDYETTLDNEVRDLIQRSLGSFRRLIFIGCGDTFGDPNFSALIDWLKRKMKTASPEHFALVTEDEVEARHTDTTWQGFVEPLGYGKSHGDLAGFLQKLFPAKTPVPSREKRLAKPAPPSPRNTKLLQDYRAFLLKDCGQMTIEGVRADMDTAQRRFDLERLFVPLKVLPSPPEFPESDPQREQKLLEWQEKHKTPLVFGKVFAKHKHLVLLALPGGGKTLLLKRLAVAYADKARRGASLDALPDIGLTPVLIRCREWREHIHRPILTLLKNIADITGQASLDGLSEVLEPLFKAGRILLLVDGLDEILDDALRATFVENLENFLRDHARTRLVVTSREAGFSLVAPSLTRFCKRWRIAPLEPEAISTLCGHWHRLVGGDSPESQAEAREVAATLIDNESLRRLAENPLLLTMLLVVKHGAGGRLPPDRVSLYGRAAEVLLDTWNIKGHDPLNPKEAVPQLAYVAFALMQAGKQTATEKELLTLLEEARDKVPQISRYAKDTPQEFLKRVELRSSLLVEVGRQAEGTGTVPFYQFRHLTFQEYLAAVAAVEGHYLGYDKTDTLLVPLRSHLTEERWKEVVPMSAVLARKQAEPLMGELVAKGNELRRQLELNEDFAGKEEWLRYPPKLPAPMARLVQCLVEEAEAAPETVTATLQLIALFAQACRAEHNWRALCRGPYGRELWHQAWLLYAPMDWPYVAWLRSTCAVLAGLQLPDTYREQGNGHAELKRLLASQDIEDVGRGLLTCSGIMWHEPEEQRPECASTLPLSEVTQHLFHPHLALQDASIWAWAFIRSYIESPAPPSVEILNHLLITWLSSSVVDLNGIAAFALDTNLGLQRNAWTPKLTQQQVAKLQQMTDERQAKDDTDATYESVRDWRAACMVAFHSGEVWSEEELAARLIKNRTGFREDSNRVVATLRQMGSIGRKYLKKLR